MSRPFTYLLSQSSLFDSQALAQAVTFSGPAMYADHFSLSNIPFGVASSSEHSKPSIATRFKDDVIFIESLIGAKLLLDIPQSMLDVLCEVSPTSLNNK